MSAKEKQKESVIRWRVLSASLVVVFGFASCSSAWFGSFIDTAGRLKGPNAFGYATVVLGATTGILVATLVIDWVRCRRRRKLVGIRSRTD